MQLVCFFLGEQEFGAPIDDVRETIELRPVTPVFHTPPCVQGITNLRGEILAVLDPALLLGLPATRQGEGTRIVIVEPTDRAAGLLVNELGSIRQVDEESIAPTPSTFTPAIAAVLRGIIPNEGRPVAVLDVEKLLASPVLTPFTERPNENGPLEAHG